MGIAKNLTFIETLRGKTALSADSSFPTFADVSGTGRPSPIGRDVTSKSASNWKVLYAFGVAVAAILIAAAISYRGTVLSLESDGWVRHTHEVLETLQHLTSELSDISASYREFVLTGQESALRSYAGSKSGVAQDEAALRQLTVDNAEQQAQLPSLEKLLARKIEFADMVIGLRRTTDPEAAAEAVRGGVGVQIMEELRGVIGVMQEAELRLLALRNADAGERLEQNKILLALTTLLSLSITAAAGWSVWHGSVGRELAEEALRASDEKLRMAVDAAELATWFWNIEQDQMSCSEKFLPLLGLAADAKLTYQAFLAAVHPDDRQRLDQNLKQTLKRDVPYYVEFRVVWPDSSVHWIAQKGRARRNAEGRAVHMQGILADITERKAAQEALKHQEEMERRSAELTRSNGDLQQFAYVAAHDLQEPLRMVTSYIQLLSRRYKGKLDTDADEFIAFAIDGAQRMQHLIADMLAYCRVGTAGKELCETSSEAALELALSNLQGALDESGGAVTHDPLPNVVADGAQLTQLFQNLVGNAIKYRGAEAPRVHVSAKKNGGKECIFSVRDNGLGIEAQYFEKIFVMFQRLHGREKFSGTGIGLALCKKIAERHGGRIWLESEPGKGSTFYVAIPERE